MDRISASPPVNPPSLPAWFCAVAISVAGGSPLSGAGDDAIHRRIDALVEGAGGGLPAAGPAEDAEFFRRVQLDFAGAIPTAEAMRAFVADPGPDKRTRAIDALLDGPGYAKRMAGWFHVHLMERRADHDLWLAWLERAFAENRPWDRMAAQIVRADFRDEANRGAAFFLSNRLEKYGQNTTDYPGLTRDVGRLLLGMDLQCAECHNHRLIDDYDQADFQGLFAAFKNLTLLPGDYPAVEEGLVSEKLKYASVFTQKERLTGPRVPGRGEIAIFLFEKGREYEVMPDRKAKKPGVPKFSPLAAFASEIPRSPTFAPNFVNRVWFLMMGRGLVEPLDQFHGDNPASHPEVLDLLAREFVARGHDIRWLVRELALTRVYQRSSRLPEGVESLPEEAFLVAKQRRLSAEQLLASARRATGAELDAAAWEELEKRFIKAFANEPKEPEHEFAPSLKSALFVMNDPEVGRLLSAGAGAIVPRLAAEPDAARVAAELYGSILSRPPTAEESAEVAAYLKSQSGDRPRALREIAWALLASTEFAVNH